MVWIDAREEVDDRLHKLWSNYVTATVNVHIPKRKDQIRPEQLYKPLNDESERKPRKTAAELKDMLTYAEGMIEQKLAAKRSASE